MKSLYFLFLAFLVIGTAAGRGEDEINKRFTEFLLQAMDNFPAWIADHNLDPSRPEGYPHPIIIGGNDHNITGDTWDRSYYGISHEFQSVSASSDLVTGRTFYINYTYGSESDLHTGKFILDGARVNSTTPIHGYGNFVKMGRKMDLKEPQVEADFTAIYVTEDGYLRYNSMGSTHSRSVFEQLVAENLDAGEEDEEELKQAMNEGIRVFVGGSAVHDAMWDYFRELLDATPIEEITGEPLPPQVKVAPRSVSKRGSVAKQVTDLPDGRQFLQTKSV